MDTTRYTFTIVRNYPTERRYTIRKKLKESFLDRLRKITGLSK